MMTLPVKARLGRCVMPSNLTYFLVIVLGLLYFVLEN